MSVPDFDAPTPAAAPEPIRFRLLGREWECQPTIPDNAVVAAQMGRALTAFADDFPEPTAAVLCDVALRFIGWCVVDTAGWEQAIVGTRVDGGAVIAAMSWIAEQYNPPAPQAATTPAPAGPLVPGAARRTSLDELTDIARTTGLSGVIARP